MPDWAWMLIGLVAGLSVGIAFLHWILTRAAKW